MSAQQACAAKGFELRAGALAVDRGCLLVSWSQTQLQGGARSARVALHWTTLMLFLASLSLSDESVCVLVDREGEKVGEQSERGRHRMTVW